MAMKRPSIAVVAYSCQSIHFWGPNKNLKIILNEDKNFLPFPFGKSNKTVEANFVIVFSEKN